MKANARRRLAILGLTGPAYLWLIVTVLLPLSAMLYFSFLTKAPFGGREAVLTLKHYQAFLDKDFLQFLAWRSVRLGFDVTAICALIGFPAAYYLARRVRGRWREALFLLVVLPFWSNALVRIFSWTVVLRPDGVLDRAFQLVAPGFVELDLAHSYSAIVIGLVLVNLIQPGVSGRSPPETAPRSHRCFQRPQAFAGRATRS